MTMALATAFWSCARLYTVRIYSMLVRVLLLRRRGQRLRVDQLQTCPWLTGRLRVEPEVEWRQRRPGTVAATLTDTCGYPALAELFGGRLVRLDGRGFVLAGVEEVFEQRERRRFRQAWWCVPEEPAAPGLDPIDQAEEREALRLL